MADSLWAGSAADFGSTADPAATPAGGSGVWAEIIGQEPVVAQLQRAVAAAHRLADAHHEHDMTHAWLLAGPPGSGRSTSALAFAAALQCADYGCGQCRSCRLVLSGAHPDVELVIPTSVAYRADEIRGLVEQAQMMPTLGSWLIIVIEDADRLNDASANALLKALEEPTPHTVWMLCAPSAADVLPTIASRTRQLTLRTPAFDLVVDVVCRRYNVTAEAAELAARASQGHIGRARVLATDPQARARRQDVLAIPGELVSLPACFAAARRLVETAQADADAVCAPLDAADEEALAAAFGDGAEGKGIGTLASRSRSESARLRKAQESRARRVLRDQFDRVLADLTGFYRDVLMLQAGGGSAAFNPDVAARTAALAAASTMSETVARLSVLREAGARLRTNAAPLLVFESALVGLWRPGTTTPAARGTVPA